MENYSDMPKILGCQEPSVKIIRGSVDSLNPCAGTYPMLSDILFDFSRSKYAMKMGEVKCMSGWAWGGGLPTLLGKWYKG